MDGQRFFLQPGTLKGLGGGTPNETNALQEGGCNIDRQVCIIRWVAGVPVYLN